MRKVRYHEMLPHEILERRKHFPAAFIGLGGLEWHGEHLAVGNDALKAEKLCELAAERSGGFAFPTIWYGEPRTTGLLEVTHDHDGQIKARMGFEKGHYVEEYDGFRRTPDEQVEFYRDLIFHVLVQMHTLKMRAVCLLCGHYPLHPWISGAIEEFNSSYTGTQAYAGTELHYAGETEAVGGDHAGKWETSYLWYLRPDCVDMSVYLNQEEKPILGILGEDPRNSVSIALGRKATELIVEGMVAKARELLKRSEES